MVGETLAYLVPMVLPLVAFVSGAEARALVASFIPLFLLGFARFALVLTQRHPLTTVFWHPVTIVVTLLGQAAALVDHVTGRVPSATRDEAGGHWRDLDRPTRLTEPSATRIPYHLAPDRPTRPESRRDRCARSSPTARGHRGWLVRRPTC